MDHASRHAEHVRRQCGFIAQTMRERGLACQRPDLETALLELTPEQFQRVAAAAYEVARGVDAREPFGLLAALRTISERAARHALSAAGAMFRADALLPIATGSESAAAFRRELGRLRREDLPDAEREQARAALVAMCGAVFHVLDDATPPVAPPSPVAGARAHAAPADAAGPADVAPDSTPTAIRGAGAAARLQVKVYGKAGALTVESAPVRGASEDRASTVMIEAASAAGDGAFDWAAKIVFACALRELPQLLAVLLGWHDSAEFRFHGGKAGKEMKLEHQAHGLFVRLRDGQRSVAVPVTDSDRYALAMLTANVMARNDTGGDIQSVLAVCRDVMSPRGPALARPA